MSREWREDDPLNGPRCLTSAMVGCVLMVVIILALVKMSHCETDTQRPHLTTRHDPIETYEPDQRLVVHNSPSHLHRNWISRHPHIFGVIVIGAGVGIGAGIGISQHRGICTESYPNGYTYVGTNPCPKDRK